MQVHQCSFIQRHHRCDERPVTSLPLQEVGWPRQLLGDAPKARQPRRDSTQLFQWGFFLLLLRHYLRIVLQTIRIAMDVEAGRSDLRQDDLQDAAPRIEVLAGSSSCTSFDMDGKRGTGAKLFFPSPRKSNRKSAAQLPLQGAQNHSRNFTILSQDLREPFAITTRTRSKLVLEIRLLKIVDIGF